MTIFILLRDVQWWGGVGAGAEGELGGGGPDDGWPVVVGREHAHVCAKMQRMDERTT